MTEAFNVANSTLLKQQVGEKAGKTEENQLLTKSLSPTPTSSSKGGGSSVGSSSPSSFELSGRQPSMGSEGEENEIIVDRAENGVALPVTSRSIREEASEKSYTFSDGERSRNPDPEESKSSSFVVPSVIRISPEANSGNGKTEPSARYSPRVPVVRPVASKTPPQESATPHNAKPRPEQPQTKPPGKAKDPPSMGERGGKGNRQAIKKDEVKRRDHSQTNFPRRNKPKRMSTGAGGAHQVDGQQAATQHVQYSNAGTRHNQQHPNRQDPHGYRQQHHGRGTHGASITSSVGGTPTMAPRRPPHHPRGFSTGSHASDMDNDSPLVPPATPLFQRLVTEEVQELKAYTRIIEEQNRQVNELERRTTDLEKRLQKKDKERADLERTLEYRETEWSNKFEVLEADRDRQRELVEQEKRMNTKLNYQVAQMEQEIHKLLTRKVGAFAVRYLVTVLLDFGMLMRYIAPLLYSV